MMVAKRSRSARQLCPGAAGRGLGQDYAPQAVIQGREAGQRTERLCLGFSDKLVQSKHDVVGKPYLFFSRGKASHL